VATLMGAGIAAAVGGVVRILRDPIAA